MKRILPGFLRLTLFQTRLDQNPEDPRNELFSWRGTSAISNPPRAIERCVQKIKKVQKMFCKQTSHSILYSITTMKTFSCRDSGSASEAAASPCAPSRTPDSVSCTHLQLPQSRTRSACPAIKRAAPRPPATPVPS